MIANETMNRRAFLSSTGALVVSLAAPADFAASAATAGAATRPAVKPTNLSSYISIDADGTVAAYYGKIDGGQGVEVAIAQMVAEEIDVSLERVRVVMGDNRTTLDMGGATAGAGIEQGGMVLRRTAAEARRLLIDMASQALGIPATDLTVTDGVVHGAKDMKTDMNKRITYAQLIGGRYFATEINWNGKMNRALDVRVKAELKKPEQFKVIGQSPRRRDLPGKVFGTQDMVNDVKLPNMLHARMIRPTVAGAVPVTVDESSIANIPGAQVVRIKDLLGVVAEKEWNAIKAARDLKVTWSQSKPNFPGHEKLHDYIRNAPATARVTERENGSIAEGFKQAVRIIEGEYEFPTQSHASMGPACAVADVRDGGATVWTSTQKPYDSARCVAELLNLPRDSVSAVWMPGTGSYGRNDQGDATADAAVLSQHLKRPVRVQYMRHEGLAWDPKGTASVNRSRAGLDASGKVIAYENFSKAFSRMDCATREGRAADVLAGHLLGLKPRPENGFGHARSNYEFDNAWLGWETVPPLMDRASPLRSTHIRDPFGVPILFGSEAFLDEIAAATSTDPIAFRLRYLKQQREHELILAAAKHYGWETRPSPRNDQANKDVAVGRGVAYRQLHGTYVAIIVEVNVHRDSGVIDIARMVCAHDCGLIVNPETTRHVLDRQLVHGTSRALCEEVRFDENMVTSVDWDTYPVLKMEHMPKSIEIVLVDRPEAAPSGASEMTLGVIPPAVSNAVFDATGVRLRHVPFTPERVKAALSRA